MSENNGAGKLLTGEELLARSRKTVDLPDGRAVEIRRVGKSRLAQIIRGIPDVSALARMSQRDTKEEVGAEQTLAAGEALGRMMEGVILAGVLSPKLFANAAAGPTPSDFAPEEQALLFREILALSRFNQEAAEEVLPLSKAAG